MARGGLVERADELARIEALLAAARAGRGALLLVTGPAGIGKTALIAAAKDRAFGAGMRMLSARGEELEAEFSFGVARQLFEPMLIGAAGKEQDLLAGAARHALIALDGTDSGMPPAASDALFAAVHGLYWLAVNAAGQVPLLVAVDDLHWADQASLRFVAYLAVRLEGLPVALMLSWRAGEAGAAADFGARVEDAAGGNVVRPAPLSLDAVHGMLGTALDAAPPAGLAAVCHAATGGNPFLLRELIQSLGANRTPVGDEAVARVARLGPSSVARSVTSRTARLGPAADEVARAAAILGDGARLRHVAVLAGIEVDDAAAAADSLAAVGVLEPGTPLRFVHPIVRTAVYDDISRADRGLRHGVAARLLAAEGADLDQVCAHLLACPPSGSAEVVQRLREAAARALTRGAAESAAAYLRRALDETVDAGVRTELLRDLGRAGMVTGDPAAVQHLREALELASEPLAQAEIAADLAQLMMVAGQWEAPAAIAQAALDDVSDGRVHDAPAVRVLAWWASFAGFDPRRAHQLDANMDSLLTAARGETAGSRLLAGVLAANLISRGERFDRARDLLDRALHEGHLAEQIGMEAPVVSQAMFAAMFLDDIPRADRLVSWLLTLSRSHGSVVGVSVAACLQAAIQVRRGDLAAAEANMRQIGDLAAAHGLTVSLPQALYWCTDALIERPGIADLAGFAQAVEPAPDLAPTMFGAMVNEIRGRLALADGDFPAARTELHSAARIYSALRQVNPNVTCWRSALALAMAAEDRAEALRLAGSELADARRLGVLRPAGIALCARGVIADGEQGLGDLAEAARLLAAAGARFEQARALVELGAALRRRDQRAAAREPLRAGLDLAQRCGALRLAKRATDELRATGARPRRAVLTGLEALTASERRIAELAAEGMSNPEIGQALFITLNTVEGHLRHAYQKLSISSRGQLPAALASAAPAG
jgi:DNA-binding CsgD family transcriptional regulator